MKNLNISMSVNIEDPTKEERSSVKDLPYIKTQEKAHQGVRHIAFDVQRCSGIFLTARL
jgi:hypothetical protein